MELDSSQSGEAEDVTGELGWRKQNEALRRNFDKLKHLYIQSTHLNIRLQATCEALWKDKEELQRVCFAAETLRGPDGDARHSHVVDRTQVEHCCGSTANLNAGCSRNESECQHCAVVQALHQLKDHLHKFELGHTKKETPQVNNEELKVEVGVKASLEVQRQRQMCKALEREVCDLRALLHAVELASAEAELRHLNAAGDFMKERDGLHMEAETAQRKYNELDVSLATVQERLLDSTRESQAELKKAVCANDNLQALAAMYRSERDEMQLKLDAVRQEVADLVKLREGDRLDQLRTVKQAKRDCEASWRLREECLLKRMSLSRQKTHQLQAKLKQAYKEIARLSFESNEFLMERRECEAQLEALQNARQEVQSISTGYQTGSTKAITIGAELTQLAARQARYFRR